MLKKILKFFAFLIVLTVILFTGLIFYSIHADTITKLPKTTPIKFLAPSADWQSSAQIPFSYEVSFEPLIEFYGEAFPVKILSTAAYNTFPDGSSRMIHRDDYIGDSLGDFGVTFYIKTTDKESFNDAIPLRIEIEGDRFIKKSSIVELIPQGKKIEIFPRINYDYYALQHLAQPSIENVYFRLFYDSVLLMEKTEVVRFHSVNEVPFFVTDRRNENNIIDYTKYFAAFVNEDDPLIDKILQEALQIDVVEKIGFDDNFSFSGYQRKDSDGDSSLSVDLQVLAIWSVLIKHNIKYSSITTTSTANEKIYTQYVRTLGESFDSTQANCVDGSVLFASVLRKIGIESCLVLLPGHMLIAYFGNKDCNSESVAFLETTMLGSVDLDNYTDDDSWLGKLKNWSGIGKTKASVTRDSFLAALDAGWEIISEVDEEDIIVIDIAECRYNGIMPIVKH